MSDRIKLSTSWRAFAFGLGLTPFITDAVADTSVSAVALANPAYTQRKFGVSGVPPESYVFMQGHFFSGIRVDRSIDRMSFRHIAESLAPELGRAQFFPAKDLSSADLLIVVHWGTTQPYPTEQEMTSRPAPVANASGISANRDPDALQANTVSGSVGQVRAVTQHDASTPWAGSGSDDTQVSTAGVSQAAEEVDREMTQGTNAELLGYDRDLRRLSQASFSSPEEDSLHFDLSTERYFIILKAYNLREKPSSGRRRAVWTVHLNMRSLGVNFDFALSSMARTAAVYAGQTTDRVRVTGPHVLTGKVELGPLIILSEEPAK